MLTLLFDEMIHLKHEKKYPDVFLRASHTNFETCDHLNNHISRCISNNTHQRQHPTNGASEKQLNVYVDLQKCANQK